MSLPKHGEVLRYSVSLVTQGNHRFYTLTMPSEILASCCFATSKDEDPIKGFQRVLSEPRAREIAEYIDSGFGTIPNAIVLSAQSEAEFKSVGKGKTVEFKFGPKSFLIIDGQHRVYGFALAKTDLRVPVVIYNGLTRNEEARLFIDINTKQRPVPNELLLAIKKLAESESSIEQLLGEIFDLFHDEPDSALLGHMSSTKKSVSKISRVTFYSALKPLVPIFGGSDPLEIYRTVNAFLIAVTAGLLARNLHDCITNTTVFRAFLDIFQDAAQRVKDIYGRDYTPDHFAEVLEPIFANVKSSVFQKPGNSYKDLSSSLAKLFKTDFTI